MFGALMGLRFFPFSYGSSVSQYNRTGPSREGATLSLLMNFYNQIALFITLDAVIYSTS